MSDFKLSPSDFAFAYDGCKRCFYYKVVEGRKAPLVLPSIFKKIDQLTIDFFEGKDVREIDKSLPPGRVIFGDRKVRSKPLRPNDGKSEHRCIINGKTDTIVEFEDGTYGIVDFKTSAINDKKAKIYSRQLHAYAIALENAETGFTQLSPVSKLGLFVMEPHAIEDPGTGEPGTDKHELALMTKTKWIEIPRDDENFKKFLSEVADLLGAGNPPVSKEKIQKWDWDGCEGCYQWCDRKPSKNPVNKFGG